MDGLPVVTNVLRCKEVARVLLQMQLPSKLVQQHLFCCDRLIAGNFNLMLVAICHQTQAIAGAVNGRWRRGWDYLESRLDEHCRSDPDFLKIENWRTLSVEALNGAFAPAEGTSAFQDVEARLSLIHDLGTRM